MSILVPTAYLGNYNFNWNLPYYLQIQYGFQHLDFQLLDYEKKFEVPTQNDSLDYREHLTFFSS